MLRSPAQAYMATPRRAQPVHGVAAPQGVPSHFLSSPQATLHPPFSPKALADLRRHLRALGVEVDELRSENRRLHSAGENGVDGTSRATEEGSRGAGARARRAVSDMSDALLRMLQEPAGRDRLRAALVAAEAGGATEGGTERAAGRVTAVQGTGRAATGACLKEPHTDWHRTLGDRHNSPDASATRLAGGAGRAPEERGGGKGGRKRPGAAGRGDKPATVLPAGAPSAAASRQGHGFRPSGPRPSSARSARAADAVNGGPNEGSCCGSAAKGGLPETRGQQQQQQQQQQLPGGLSRPDWAAQVEALTAAAAAGALLEQLRADNAALHARLQVAVAELEAVGREQRRAARLATRGVQASEEPVLPAAVAAAAAQPGSGMHPCEQDEGEWRAHCKGVALALLLLLLPLPLPLALLLLLPLALLLLLLLLLLPLALLLLLLLLLPLALLLLLLPLPLALLLLLPLALLLLLLLQQ